MAGLSKTYTLGRDPENDVVVDVPMVSGRHARLSYDPDLGLGWIEDLGSSNGTFLGSPPRRITRSSFSAGDTISFGSHAISGAWLLARLGVQAKDSLTFRGDTMIVGRDPSCDRVIDAAQVSSRHARLFRQAGRVLIEDLGSSNGTSVNDRRIAGPTAVSSGDTIHLGTYSITLSIVPAASPPPLKTTEWTEVAEQEIPFFTATHAWSIGVFLAQALLIGLVMVAVGSPTGPKRPALFGLALAAVWFGLSGALVDRVIDRIRGVDDRGPLEFSPALGLVGALMVGACLIQVSLTWFIVAMALSFEASHASAIGLIGLASLVGLSLGLIIRSVSPGAIAAALASVVVILMIGVVSMIGPVAGLAPPHWAFEGLLLIEPNLRAIGPEPFPPPGMKACVMALTFMFVGLSAAAAFITWGPGSASHSRMPRPDPAGL